VFSFFSEEPVEGYLERWKINLKREIESTDVNYVLNVSEADYIGYLVSKYSLTAPVLHEKDARMHQEEIRLNGHEKPTAENPTMLTGKLKITILIPFEGNPHLFHCTPSEKILDFPKGEVQHQNRILQLSYEISSLDANELKNVFNRDIESIKSSLKFVKKDILNHNLWVKEKAKIFLSERKNQILQNVGFAKSLGIPFQEDSSVPKTYPIPLKVAEITITKPKVPQEPFKPEPTIEQSDYEKILETIAHMSVAMERNPRTFSKLHEEEIRDFFLIILNSHFKGQATGETFNNEGKTDILLRVKDKNVFIAECKFWKGKKSFLKTIDQILSYMSWRDTKATILVFYKGKHFSKTLTKIAQTISKHEYYKRPFKLISQNLPEETTFTSVFSSRTDKNRELFLTAMVFPIFHFPQSYKAYTLPQGAA
jgi:hypothetical protein